jgi:endo-1,4-beta-xylanase
MTMRPKFLLTLIAVPLLAACMTVLFADTQEPTLKDAFKGDFLIGAAINSAQIYGRDTAGDALLEKQFNAISPENVLKWGVVHPQPDQYDFDAADHYVALGEKYHMSILGHNLVWHSQTPRWVFQDANGKPLTRDALLKRMHDHIQTVVGRYKGRIHSWDVVNEALNDDGTLRQSQWFKIIGPDYIAKAFEYAHEADPSAELNYNDYSLENEPKRNGAIKLIQQLKADGVPISAIGLQGHDKMDWPTVEQEDATIEAFAKLGLKVKISELDVDVLPSASQNRGADVSQNYQLQAQLNPYAKGLPDSVQQDLAKRYADLFRVFLKHKDVVTRVTFWGVNDGDSWLNNWPVRGRTSYPLLFDRNNQPKPAFNAVIKVAEQDAGKK